MEQYLTVAETVTAYSQCYLHPRRVGEVIERVGLAAEADARVKTLSGGQQRRLDMAVALAGDPELLFLDEPTTGFDPAARHEAWEVVKSLAELGKTILLTTHYMDEPQHATVEQRQASHVYQFDGIPPRPVAGGAGAAPAPAPRTSISEGRALMTSPASAARNRPGWLRNRCVPGQTPG